MGFYSNISLREVQADMIARKLLDRVAKEGEYQKKHIHSDSPHLFSEPVYQFYPTLHYFKDNMVNGKPYFFFGFICDKNLEFIKERLLAGFSFYFIYTHNYNTHTTNMYKLK